LDKTEVSDFALEVEVLLRCDTAGEFLDALEDRSETEAECDLFEPMLDVECSSDARDLDLPFDDASEALLRSGEAFRRSFAALGLEDKPLARLDALFGLVTSGFGKISSCNAESSMFPLVTVFPISRLGETIVWETLMESCVSWLRIS
jgi:hypothetical protein